MATRDENARPGTSETNRVEAFSDGVFAVAITLLVLDLKVPHANGNRRLLQALADEWPVYFAYGVSFATVLIMWVNHHIIFRCVRRSDHWLFLINGLVLLAVTLVPFPTSLLSAYLEQPGRTVAAVIYSATFVMIALVYTVLWRYVLFHPNLQEPGLSPRFLRRFTRQYNLGVPLYLVAVMLAFVNVVASLAVCGALAIVFALPTPIQD